MKIKLMVQSLSPLFLLTIIRNWSFKTQGEEGKVLKTKEFVIENGVLILTILVCFIWVICSIWFFFEFLAFKWSDKKDGYEIVNVFENKEASLNFFITLILPLMLDDIDTIQGSITFIVIILLICILLYRTDLYCANPVLAILGYRVYEFEFMDNESMATGKYVGICKGKVSEGQTIEYKVIDKNNKNIIYIKGMKK